MRAAQGKMEQRLMIEVAKCKCCGRSGLCRELDQSATSYTLIVSGGLMSSIHAGCILEHVKAAKGKPVTLRVDQRNRRIAEVLGFHKLTGLALEDLAVPQN